jgi:uncharacterized membrane-anchored protein
MKYIIAILFVVMIIAQWFVPLSMMMGQENIIREGKVFKFKTAPVDPSDPFRGKYITLRFEASVFPVDSSLHLDRHDKIYVTITEDANGFAAIQSVSAQAPSNTVDFVEAKTSFMMNDTLVNIRYPFDRFYMEESKASEAEKAYWEAGRDSTQIAYALVAVSHGKTALKDVIVNDKSITDLVREMNKGD